jgi:uncharacterized phage protein (TIGR01671 family)
MVMREYKFRGQTITGEWVYGLLCKPTAGKYAGKTFISNSVGMPFAYEVRPETVGQFTGLKDKNGREIYEGDILLNKDEADFHAVKIDLRFIVSYYVDGFCLTNITHSVKKNYLSQAVIPTPKRVAYKYYSHIEVIGNIYETPELLKP